MAAEASIKISKTMPFKGGTRVYSNRYHFTAGAPVDATHWTTFAAAIIGGEKGMWDSDTTIVEATGYGPGSDVPVWSATYATVGTLSPGGTDAGTPGHTAGLVRYSTAARSSKNHPIYLFNYYHRPWINNTLTAKDKLASDQVSTYNTFASAWVAGISDGTVTHVRCSPNGAVATGVAIEEYVTHRDFPYSPSL